MKLFANGITNDVLAKIVSIESLAGITAGIFMAGVIWTNLHSGIASAQTVSETNKETLVKVSQKLNDVRTDIELIRQTQVLNQKNQEKRNDEQTQELRDIKGMLNEMSRSMRSNGGH